MAAVIAKNELTASKRRCDLIVYADGGVTLAPRGTSFISLGILFVSGASSPDYVLGVGTCTNKRRTFSFTSGNFTAAVTDICTKVAHGLETGDGPINVSTTTTLPAPLAAATSY